MYIYSVTINILKEAEDRWVDFMKTKHIAEVLETGYFISALMRKVITKTKSEFAVYNIEYKINTEEDYYNYQKKSAPALQKDIADRFAGEFTAERTFYKVVFEQ